MVEIKIGDCVDRLKDLEDSSVDSIICDPPYGLKFMKEWDDIGDGSQQREWHRAWLLEAHRVLKPNGVLKAFSGTRTSPPSDSDGGRNRLRLYTYRGMDLRIRFPKVT